MQFYNFLWKLFLSQLKNYKVKYIHFRKEICKESISIIRFLAKNCIFKKSTKSGVFFGSFGSIFFLTRVKNHIFWTKIFKKLPMNLGNIFSLFLINFLIFDNFGIFCPKTEILAKRWSVKAFLAKIVQKSGAYFHLSLWESDFNINWLHLQ